MNCQQVGMLVFPGEIVLDSILPKASFKVQSVLYEICYVRICLPINGRIAIYFSLSAILFLSANIVPVQKVVWIGSIFHIKCPPPSIFQYICNRFWTCSTILGTGSRMPAEPAQPYWWWEVADEKSQERRKEQRDRWRRTRTSFSQLNSESSLLSQQPSINWGIASMEKSPSLQPSTCWGIVSIEDEVNPKGWVLTVEELQYHLHCNAFPLLGKEELFAEWSLWATLSRWWILSSLHSLFPETMLVKPWWWNHLWKRPLGSVSSTLTFS